MYFHVQNMQLLKTDEEIFIQKMERVYGRGCIYFEVCNRRITDNIKNDNNNIFDKTIYSLSGKQVK